MICVDTSFLISYYGTDVNTPAAKQCFSVHIKPLLVHFINEFEFDNALRLLVFRGKISNVERAAWLNNYLVDKKSGIIVHTDVVADMIFLKAAVLAKNHTETIGNRAYDILHIAAAKLLGATEFWSFDGKQRALAAAEGMTVGP